MPAESPRAPRVLQIHVSRRCNLRCRHCYSSSGPEAAEEMPLDLLRGAIDDAARQGYGAVSVSGGEPLMYRALPGLAAHTRARGLGVAVITNGMLMDPRRLEPLRGLVAVFAVSLDGAPARHNQMRGHPRAFEAMRDRLRHLRALDVPFGFAFTLSRDNLDELDWAADFAVEQGGRFLQIYPLTEVGRAAADAAVAAAAPDAAVAEQGVRAAARLKARLEGRLRVTIVYQPRARVAERGAVVARTGETLADAVSILVIEPDGWVVPMAHGFAREHALGSLRDARLSALAERWFASGRAAAFRATCAEVRARATPADGAPFLDWANEVRRAAAA